MACVNAVGVTDMLLERVILNQYIYRHEWIVQIIAFRNSVVR